jgi:homoserine kinase
MQIKIKIPASSANLGPGFDCLSLGLNLYNQYTVETHTKKMDFHFSPPIKMPLESNKIFSAYQKICQIYQWEPIPFHVNCAMQIPIGIGLGSSANAILSGVLIARTIHKESLDKKLILQDALALENHPDNLAGSLYGGFNISTMKNEEVQNFHFKVGQKLSCLLIQTKKTTNTTESRKSLPAQYSKTAVVHNLSRSALVATAFVKKDFDLLSTALEDELHQKYRLNPKLNLEELKDLLQGEDYFGLALSGSGPSLIVFCATVSQRILCILDEYFSRKKEYFKIYTLKIDDDGASVVS